MRIEVPFSLIFRNPSSRQIIYQPLYEVPIGLIVDISGNSYAIV